MCKVNGTAMLKIGMGLPMFTTVAIFAIAKTQSTISRWAAEERNDIWTEQNVFYCKKKNSDICSNMDKITKLYVKWNETDIEQTLCNSQTWNTSEVDL